MGGGEGEGFEGWGKGRDVTRQTKRAGGGGGTTSEIRVTKEDQKQIQG